MSLNTAGDQNELIKTLRRRIRLLEAQLGSPTHLNDELISAGDHVYEKEVQRLSEKLAVSH